MFESNLSILSILVASIKRCFFIGAVAISFNAASQVPISFDFNDPSLTDGNTIKLEGYVYEPEKSNGKTILMTHGSTGGVKENIALSVKFSTIAAQVTKAGYRFVVYTRKGRGMSQGIFQEETGKCDRPSLDWEVADAYPQMKQVVAQVRQTYNSPRLILMGHSRGGFISALYATRNPSEVLAVVNISGVWSAFCEKKNNGYSHDALAKFAGGFKNQFWAYFKNDSYFSPVRFNDPDYEWLSDIASRNGLTFKVYPDVGLPDGHATGYKRPDLWSDDVFSWLTKVE